MFSTESRGRCGSLLILLLLPLLLEGLLGLLHGGLVGGGRGLDLDLEILLRLRHGQVVVPEGSRKGWARVSQFHNV